MRLVTFSVSALAVLNASAAFGQATEPFLLGTIYIGSDASTNSTNTVGIDNEDLTRTNPTDLQDVFKSQPTISVGSSLPISQKTYVNGVEETNLNFTIDGARQNNRIFHHAASNYIDPELLKAVRVDPGVAPADAGPSAIGGAIAFETKDAADLLEGDQSVGARVSSEYHSNGGIFTNSIAAYGQSGAFDYLMFLKSANGGLRESGNGTTIVGSTTSLLSGLLKFGYTGTNGSRLEFSYESVKDDDMRPNRADFAALTRRGVTNDGTRQYTLQRQNAVVTWTGGQISDVWNPTVQIAWSSTDLFTGPFTGATDAYSGTTSSFNGKIENEFSLASGTITAGLDFYNETTEINGEATAVFFAQEKANNVGLYAQARLNVADNVRVSSGLRYDFQNFEGVDGTKYDNSGLSANASVDFDVTDTVTLSAGASRVWGGIQLAESFVFDTSWVYPASIEPVTSENFFLGANVNLGAWDLNGKVFRTSIDNARTLYSGTTTQTYGTNPGDTANLETEGFELGAKYSWASGFVRVAYANVDSRVEGFAADGYTGRYLTTPLGDILTIEAAHTFDEIGLTIGADAQITQDNDVFYLGSPSGTQEGFRVVNAFAEYKPPSVKGLTIRAGINNLFDEQYSERGTYGQEFGSVTPLAEPGRSFALNVTYKF